MDPRAEHEWKTCIVEDGAIAVSKDQIIEVGPTDVVTNQFSSEMRINATGKAVTPGFIDAHTHFIFAGTRETELEMKIKGVEYMKILRREGGILRTVRDTRAASKQQLLEICKKRGANLLIHRTTTIEAKSGQP